MNKLHPSLRWALFIIALIPSILLIRQGIAYLIIRFTGFSVNQNNISSVFDFIKDSTIGTIIIITLILILIPIVIPYAAFNLLTVLAPNRWKASKTILYCIFGVFVCASLFRVIVGLPYITIHFIKEFMAPLLLMTVSAWLVFSGKSEEKF